MNYFKACILKYMQIVFIVCIKLCQINMFCKLLMDYEKGRIVNTFHLIFLLKIIMTINKKSNN